MSSARHSTVVAIELARLLSDHVKHQALIDRDMLAVDPIRALADDPSISVTLVSPSSLPRDCSIAASYDPHVRPARILISNDAAPGRRAFSALHEYGHHLRNAVIDVLDVLFTQPDGGGALEEQMCDEFASSTLIPAEVRHALSNGGVTARAVADLCTTTSASREACAVAAVRALPAPGYVMLLDPQGRATFTARTDDLPPVARGTEQHGDLLRRAARSGHGRGRERVTFATGNRSPEMHLDSARISELATIAVLTSDSPAWDALSAPPLGGAEIKEGYCTSCARSFRSAARACPNCGEPPCDLCGHCECQAMPARGERRCEGPCGLTLGPGAFPTPAATLCRGCAAP